VFPENENQSSSTGRYKRHFTSFIVRYWQSIQERKKFLRASRHQAATRLLPRMRIIKHTWTNALCCKLICTVRAGWTSPYNCYLNQGGTPKLIICKFKAIKVTTKPFVFSLQKKKLGVFFCFFLCFFQVSFDFSVLYSLLRQSLRRVH